MVTFLGLLLTLRQPSERSRATSDPARGSVASGKTPSPSGASAQRPALRPFQIGLAPTTEEIVAGKLSQFSGNRRELTRRMARHFGVAVPADVERFFDAAEAGRWEEVDALLKLFLDRQRSERRSRELEVLWQPIVETHGAAKAAHDWPAQKLLDYGNAVLGSLRPGMVYVGGTDTGRFVPTFLNETSDGERHVVLTQNALADATYLDYVRFMYGDTLAALTQEDSQRAFRDYVTDAQKRLDHDRQFPNEPKQLRPGENIRATDQDAHFPGNRVEVTGVDSVMAVNERLLQIFMDKNPGVSFALEESFPLKSTYPNASPLGPIMELRVQDGPNALTSERAAQSVEYWRDTAQQLVSDPESADSRHVRMVYAKMAAAQASLFLEHNHTTEAEQVSRFASQIFPTSPEAVFQYVGLLAGQNRLDEALPVAEAAVKAEPESPIFRSLLDDLKRRKRN